MNNEIMFVNGEDAKIIQAAEEVELRAFNREKERANGALVPMIWYETPTEREVISAKLALEREYQEKNQLAFTPILVPEPRLQLIAGQPTAMQQRYSLPYPDIPYHPVKERTPSEMELEKLLLSRAILRRIGETVYCYSEETHYYQKQDMGTLRTLIMEKLSKELGVSGQARQLDNIIKFLSAEPTIEITETSPSSRYCCLLNGIMDWRTGNLLPHTPQIFLTWRLEIAWYGAQECPCCDYFFHSIAGGDPMIIERLWQALGFLLLPDDSGKRFVLLQGKGNTGKSVFGNLVASCFKSEAVGSVALYNMGDRFAPATLVGKRINVSMDMSNNSLSDQAVAFVKQITGRDAVLVEEKYKAAYTTKIPCKLLFGSNHILRTGSADPAFLQRALVIPFRYPVDKERQIPDLAQRLKAELPGIFYKAMNAYVSVVRNHYRFTGDEMFDLSRTQQTGDVIQNQDDTLMCFIQECCTACPNGFVPTAILHDYYLRFCANLQKDGIDNRQIFSTKFRNAAAGFLEIEACKQRVNGSSQNGYRGLALR